MKEPNYTPEQTAKLVADYKAAKEAGKDNETIVKELAESLKKTERSIRAKLVRESAYVAEEKKKSTKKKDEGPSKKELLATLSKITGNSHDGLDGATKEAIGTLIALFSKNAEEKAEVSEASA